MLLLAQEGYLDELDHFDRTIFGSQGIKVAPRPGTTAPGPALATASQLRGFAAEHNAKRREARRASQAAVVVAKARAAAGHGRR